MLMAKKIKILLSSIGIVLSVIFLITADYVAGGVLFVVPVFLCFIILSIVVLLISVYSEKEKKYQLFLSFQLILVLSEGALTLVIYKINYSSLSLFLFFSHLLLLVILSSMEKDLLT